MVNLTPRRGWYYNLLQSGRVLYVDELGNFFWPSLSGKQTADISNDEIIRNYSLSHDIKMHLANVSLTAYLLGGLKAHHKSTRTELAVERTLEELSRENPGINPLDFDSENKTSKWPVLQIREWNAQIVRRKPAYVR